PLRLKVSRPIFRCYKEYCWTSGFWMAKSTLACSIVFAL
ncbi:uncharacterized protein METZ01_LOCUS455089, partial [marine metagenome]